MKQEVATSSGGIKSASAQIVTVLSVRKYPNRRFDTTDYNKKSASLRFGGESDRKDKKECSGWLFYDRMLSHGFFCAKIRFNTWTNSSIARNKKLHLCSINNKQLIFVGENQFAYRGLYSF